MWYPQIGVCSWSLLVNSVPELVRLTDETGAALRDIVNERPARLSN